LSLISSLSFFFFNDTATTEIYTLSLHDALPISRWYAAPARCWCSPACWRRDRKSTRLNSSHVSISYAVFCLKKKKEWEAGVLSRRNGFAIQTCGAVSDGS